MVRSAVLWASAGATALLGAIGLGGRRAIRSMSVKAAKPELAPLPPPKKVMVFQKAMRSELGCLVPCLHAALQEAIAALLTFCVRFPDPLTHHCRSRWRCAS